MAHGRTGRTSVLAGVVLLLMTACGSGDGALRSQGAGPVPPPVSSDLPPTSPAPPPPSCAEQTLGTLDLGGQVGQLLMVGIPATDPVGGYAELDGVPVGGVFLRGRSSAGADAVRTAVAQLQAAAPLPLLVAVDQEGGQVQTLKGPGFDLVPSALEQAAQGPAALATTVAGWAAQLHGAGITMDLAPVADTVPAGTEAANPPIGASDRQYGSDPDQVAGAVTAAVRALQDAGVAATVKHFPGLGRVHVDTDTDTGATDPETSPTDPFVRPFADAITADTAAVMVSSASYPQLDPDRIAPFSPAVIGLLRGRLGFGGVVMTDDLGQAGAVAQTPVGQRVVDAVSAGVDVVLTVRAADAAPMAHALVEAATADPVVATRVTESAGRVLALKERFGLLTC